MQTVVGDNGENLAPFPMTNAVKQGVQLVSNPVFTWC